MARFGGTGVNDAMAVVGGVLDACRFQSFGNLGEGDDLHSFLSSEGKAGGQARRQNGHAAV